MESQGLRNKNFINKNFLLMIIILLVTLSLRIFAVYQHSMPAGDEGAYIELAKNIAEGKGFWSKWRWYFSDKDNAIFHPEHNWQPLYSYLLAPFVYFFGPKLLIGQILSLLFGLIAVILTFLLGKVIFDERIGLWGAFVVAISYPQIIASSTAMTEAFFGMLLLAIFLLVYRKKEWNNWYWGFLGGFLALLYLTRVNGMLVIVAFIFYLLITKKFSLKKPKTWIGPVISLATLILICLPWFLRNYYYFEDAFYSQARYILWLDNWEDTFSIDAPEHTFFSYISSHDIVQIVKRLYWAFHFVGRYLAFYPDIPGYFLLGFVGLFLINKWREYSIIYITIAISFLIFVWASPVFIVYRYFVPYHPLIILWAITGLDKAFFPFNEKRFLKIGIVLLPLLLTNVDALYSNLRESDYNEYKKTSEISLWLIENTKKTDVIMTRSELCRLVYEYDRKTIVVPNNPEEVIFGTAKKYKVNYLIIHKENLNSESQWYRKAFQRYWISTEQGLKEIKAPSFLKKVYRSKSGEYLIYKLE